MPKNYIKFNPPKNFACVCMEHYKAYLTIFY